MFRPVWPQAEADRACAASAWRPPGAATTGPGRPADALRPAPAMGLARRVVNGSPRTGRVRAADFGGRSLAPARPARRGWSRRTSPRLGATGRRSMAGGSAAWSGRVRRACAVLPRAAARPTTTRRSWMTMQRDGIGTHSLGSRAGPRGGDRSPSSRQLRAVRGVHRRPTGCGPMAPIEEIEPRALFEFLERVAAAAPSSGSPAQVAQPAQPPASRGRRRRRARRPGHRQGLGMEVPVFGHPAPCPEWTGHDGGHHGGRVFAGRCLRMGPDRFGRTAGTSRSCRDGHRRADIEALTVRLAPDSSRHRRQPGAMVGSIPAVLD